MRPNDRWGALGIEPRTSSITVGIATLKKNHTTRPCARAVSSFQQCYYGVENGLTEAIVQIRQSALSSGCITRE